MRHSLSGLFKACAAALAVSAAMPLPALAAEVIEREGAVPSFPLHQAQMFKADGTELNLVELTCDNYEEAFRQCDTVSAYIFFYRPDSPGYYAHVNDILDFAHDNGKHVKILMFDMTELESRPEDYRDHPLKRLADREVKIIPTVARVTKPGRISVGTFNNCRSPDNPFRIRFMQVDCLQPLDGRPLKEAIDGLPFVPPAAEAPDFSALPFPKPFIELGLK